MPKRLPGTIQERPRASRERPGPSQNDLDRVAWTQHRESLRNCSKKEGRRAAEPFKSIVKVIDFQLFAPLRGNLPKGVKMTAKPFPKWSPNASQTDPRSPRGFPKNLREARARPERVHERPGPAQEGPGRRPSRPRGGQGTHGEPPWPGLYIY